MMVELNVPNVESVGEKPEDCPICRQPMFKPVKWKGEYYICKDCLMKGGEPVKRLLKFH